jgi:hypothetical protein
MAEKRVKKVITEYDLITTQHDRPSGEMVRTLREYRETLELLDERKLPRST